jgi:hypothetical protein
MKKSKTGAVFFFGLAAAAIGANISTNTPAPLNDRTSAVAPVVSSSAQNCDPNYSGCVPIASDVDCAGGSGDGPAYVTGPIRVIGTDIYDLDGDSDGIACE